MNFSNYDEYFDDYDFEPVQSYFEQEMELKGWDFITNFNKSHEIYYKRAAEIHGIKVFITDKVYSGTGMLLNDPGYLALYIEKEHDDLSDFWHTFEILRS